MSSNYTIESFRKVKKRIRRYKTRTGRIRRIVRSYRPRTITRIIKYPRRRRVIFTYRYPNYSTYSIPFYRTIVLSPSKIPRKEKTRNNQSNEKFIFLIIIALVFGFILGNIYFKN